MPMTVETEPLDVAESSGLKPGELALVGVEYEPHPDDSPEFVAEHTATDEVAAEAATVDYDDAVLNVTAEQAEAAATAEAATTNTATPVAVQVAATLPRSVDEPAERLREIGQASRELHEVREKIVTIAGELKALKEEEKGLVARLMRLTSAVANDSTRPLLGVAVASGKLVEATARTYQGDPVDPLADMPAAEPSTATVDDALAADKESWRAYRFDDPDHFPALSSQKAIVAKLAENSPPINTIGDLLDFQKPIGDYAKTLTDIKGIGTGKAEKIENALEQFWVDHPELVQEAVDAS